MSAISEGGGGGMHLKRGGTPLQGSPAALSLTVSAGFNRICDRLYQLPPALATSSKRLSHRFWLLGPLVRPNPFPLGGEVIS